MATIFVTGANGQLGQSIHSLSTYFSGLDFHFTDLPELDLTQTPQTEAYIRKLNPDYLINCAAYTDVDRAEETPQLAYRLNRDVPELFARLSVDLNFKFLHVSTDYVFNGKSFIPYSEEDPTSPVSVYGKSKKEGEAVLSGTQALILRTSWLYSEYGKNFVKTILSLSKEKESLDVVYDQIGSPTYGTDLAFTILSIIDGVEKRKYSWIPGIFHYSNEGVCSWYDIAVEIIRLSGSSCRINAVRTSQFPRPAPRPAFSLLAKEKIKSAFQLQIPYWRNSLAQCITHLKS